MLKRIMIAVWVLIVSMTAYAQQGITYPAVAWESQWFQPLKTNQTAFGFDAAINAPNLAGTNVFTGPDYFSAALIATGGFTNTGGFESRHGTNGAGFSTDTNTAHLYDHTGAEIQFNGGSFFPMSALSLGTVALPWGPVYAGSYQINGTNIMAFWVKTNDTAGLTNTGNVALNGETAMSIVVSNGVTLTAPTTNKVAFIGFGGLLTNGTFTGNSGITLTVGNNAITVTTNGAFAAGTINTNVITPGLGSAALYPSNAFTANSTNLGTVVIANNGLTSPNGTTAQQLGVSPNGYFAYWSGSKWLGDFNFGYFSSGSASQMTAGNTAMRLYLGGNTNDQTSGHSSDDNEIKLSSGNPFGSGAFYSVNYITTNGALAGAIAVSTNSSGQIIYEIDQHAASFGTTQDQTVYGDNPRTVMMLSDQSFFPLAIAVNTARGAIVGDYEFEAFDGSNMVTHFLRTIPGVFDYRNSTNIDTLKIDGPNNTVTINGTLSQLGDIQMPHTTLDSNGTSTTVGQALANVGTANFKLFKGMGSGGTAPFIDFMTHEAGEGMGILSTTVGGVYLTTLEGHVWESYNHFGLGTNSPFEMLYATHFTSNVTFSSAVTNRTLTASKPMVTDANKAEASATLTLPASTFNVADPLAVTFANQNSNLFLAGASNNGAAAVPTWRKIDVTDLFNGTSASSSTFLRGDGSWATPAGGGSGTVTSVGLSMPSVFSVASSPVTTSGTIAVTLAGSPAPGAELMFDGTNLVFMDPTLGYWWTEDFDQQAGLTDDRWSVFTSGTGAAAAIVSGITNGPGIYELATGTTTTGVADFTRGKQFTGMPLGGGYTMMQIRVRVVNPSDGTDNFFFRAGYGNQLNIDFTQGNYFETTNIASGNWLCKTDNSGTRFQLDSGVAVKTNTFQTLKWIQEGDNSKVTFYIDGSPVATNTTTASIPFNVGSIPDFELLKTAGTTSRVVDIDYIQFFQKFGTARSH